MTTQAELADLIDRSPAAVSQATREGHHCAGYPIADWAEFTASGRVKGYHVPETVREALTISGAGPEETGPKRLDLPSFKRSFTGDGASGPSPNAPSPHKAGAEPKEENEDTSSSPAESGEFSLEELPKLALRKRMSAPDTKMNTQAQRPAPPEPPAAAGTPGRIDASRRVDASSRTSLLPQGEDYFRPVAAGSTAHALAAIAREDTPTARAITTTFGTAAGALLGYHMTDENPGGALIGAGIGFLAMMYGMDPSVFHE